MPGEQQFRIPKVIVPVFCYTIEQEKIEGEIFLDVSGSTQYTSQQVLDFFNSGMSFFPIRTTKSPKPILLRKESLVRVDIVRMMETLEEEPSISLAARRQVTIHLHTLGPISATVILDVPEEYSRILDLLNMKRTFFPAIVDSNFSLVNSTHIYKIEEA